MRGEILKALLEGGQIPVEKNEVSALRSGHEIFGPHTTKRRAIIKELVTDHIKALFSSTLTSEQELKSDPKSIGRASKVRYLW